MEEDKLLDLLVSVKVITPIYPAFTKKFTSSNEFQNMVRSDPTTARTTLAGHPNLAYALMKEMVVLDVVDPEVLTRTLQAATGVQSTPAPTAPPVAPNYGQPPQTSAPSYPPPSTPSYPPPSNPSYPPPSTPSYPPSVPSYPPPSSTPSYPPPSTPSYLPPPAQPSYAPPQPQPSIPPHMYQQSRQQQQQQQPTPPPPQSRGPPPQAAAPMGLAPEQQAMIQRLAMLTPDQIAALPPADRAALLELRRQLGLS
ncbi:hypothetical protein FRC07_012363 [Ceratobasidium sp. 392]|nr:hypothetical protein FRC07_012363 [Ceratobasidium sp. 392]